MSLPDGLSLDAGELVLGIALALVSIGVSTLVGLAVLLRLSADYFVDEASPNPPVGPDRFVHFARKFGKNLLGVVLVLVGAVLSLPGVPGQGLLTMLIGVVLLDVPGKRRLERRIVASARVLRALNGLRTRFAREPLRAPRFPPRNEVVPGKEDDGGEK